MEIDLVAPPLEPNKLVRERWTAGVEFEACLFLFLKAVFPAIVIAGVALFFYLGILAHTHVKARLLVDFYRELGRQVDKQEQLKKSGADAHHLEKFQELQGYLRKLLEEQGVLKPSKPRT